MPRLEVKVTQCVICLLIRVIFLMSHGVCLRMLKDWLTDTLMEILKRMV